MCIILYIYLFNRYIPVRLLSLIIHTYTYLAYLVSIYVARAGGLFFFFFFSFSII